MYVGLEISGLVTGLGLEETRSNGVLDGHRKKDEMGLGSDAAGPNMATHVESSLRGPIRATRVERVGCSLRALAHGINRKKGNAWDPTRVKDQRGG